MVRCVLWIVVVSAMAGCTDEPDPVEAPIPSALEFVLRNDGDADLRYKITLFGPGGGGTDGGTLAPAGSWRERLAMDRDGVYTLRLEVTNVMDSARASLEWSQERSACEVPIVHLDAGAEARGGLLFGSGISLRFDADC